LPRKAVILAGGKGTRLAPYTLVFPKPLMPLGETPILEIVIRQLVRRGFEEVTLAVGHLAQLIESYFGDGARFDVKIRYSREDRPLGTAGPLAAVGDLDEPFLVMNGDILTTLDYGSFLADHVESGAAASVATFRRVYTVDFGVVETDGERIVGYIEKPETTCDVSMGINALSPHVLERIRPGERLDMPDLLLQLIGAGEEVRSVPFEGRWLDIGRHDDFAAAQEQFIDHRREFLGGRD
jgi:Nucleoside-diphosphate-sugar pyrophosphorylase involved in lipopolysaccharide biosynthesis/translation initiation factor 2B, gamma/epsilon subunits (eIF-2Bgamma/eIF-2Bepsilon)